MSFKKLAANPIIPHLVDENRDPKVVWDAAHKQWILALYLRSSTYALFGSADLKKWSKLSEVRIPGTDECPDFIPMRLDGKPDASKWVFWGANGRYMVGSFDGKQFHPETVPIESNYGNTVYAAQTYSNAPRGRTIQIAWMRGSDFPGSTWNQQMAFPSELGLVSTTHGPRLKFQPVREIVRSRVLEVKSTDGHFTVPSGLFDLEGKWTVPTSGALKVKVNGVDVVYEAVSRTLSVLDRKVELPKQDALELRILADRTSIEIYAQGGLVSIPLFVLPKSGAVQGVSIETSGRWTGRARVFELKSAWGSSGRRA